MKNWPYTLTVLLLILFTLTQTGCGKPAEPKLSVYSRDFFAMDTYITCQVLAEDRALAESGLDRVEQAFLSIDQLTNRFDSKSDISVLNQNAGIAPVTVNKEVFEIVDTAIDWSDKTDGAFNILIGSAMDRWGFGTKHPAVPAEQDLKQALTKTDYHKILLNPKQLTIFLPEGGMVMDLGGVAKGYATDKAVAALKELGIKNAIINAGGNVYAMGRKADDTFWKVGVQDPKDPKGIAAVLQASDVALVSSGDYQRYFEVNGIRYHHILDPGTGCPARASAGTTIIMPSATVADILSTVLFIKGPTEGMALAEDLPQVKAAMIINGDGKIYKTRNFNDYLAEP